MLIVKEKELNKTCNKCIVKSACSQICQEEYDRIIELVQNTFHLFITGYKTRYPKNFYEKISILLIDHFENNNCCPMCGHKYCIFNDNVVSCLYCNYYVIYHINGGLFKIVNRLYKTGRFNKIYKPHSFNKWFNEVMIKIKGESLMFDLNKEQIKKYNDWLEEHDKSCSFTNGMNQGAIGGWRTYTFTRTSLGTVSKIKCACGEEVDVTDYKSW